MKELKKEWENYSVTRGYDKIYIKDEIENKIDKYELNTKELTARVLQLGEKLKKIIKIPTKNTGIQFFGKDELKQMLITYNYNNKLELERIIKEWYESNIYPFNVTTKYNNDSDDTMYNFAALCIRLQIIVEYYTSITNRINNTSSSISPGVHEGKWYFIFDDYIRDDYFQKNPNNVSYYEKFEYRLDDEIVLEYITRLFNDINNKFHIWNFKEEIIFQKDNKKNIIFNYYDSPIAAVYNSIAEMLCGNELRVKKCEYCNCYMTYENSNQRYHEECNKEHDLERKKR